MRTLLTTLHSKYVHASLALPCLAAYCGDECGEIMIREYSVHEPKESLLARIVGCGADVVCFSVYIWNRTLTLELVACLKQINPQLKIVLGGPEISFEEPFFFSRYPVDALICGEGEMPLRHLLQAWNAGEKPEPLPGLKTPASPDGEGWSLLSHLDELPSPFAAGLVDLTRGLVYYESSRGCPYSCSFCMSALDDRVRSFSMERIKADLGLLIASRVPLIKFVDRTFNYDARRTREIFSFILERNLESRFHFEIGAHLLDEETLTLLEEVPDGVFQFEIGVQSTLPQTLANVGRKASLETLEKNVRQLVGHTKIHLHLDLIAGLPGEGFFHFLTSIDRVHALGGGHLQIEPVKLLPGAPLRRDAEQWGIRFDPNPPYTILSSADLTYAELERLRGIGRLFDLLVNSERFPLILDGLTRHFGTLSPLLDDLDAFWRDGDLYGQSRSLRDLYLIVNDYLTMRFAAEQLAAFRELLARDYAHNERVVGGSAPAFFDDRLTDEEQSAVRKLVKAEVAGMDRAGKVQYFAAAFQHLPQRPGRRILVFLYVAKTASGLDVRELELAEVN